MTWFEGTDLESAFLIDQLDLFYFPNYNMEVTYCIISQEKNRT